MLMFHSYSHILVHINFCQPPRLVAVKFELGLWCNGACCFILDMRIIILVDIKFIRKVVMHLYVLSVLLIKGISGDTFSLIKIKWNVESTCVRSLTLEFNCWGNLEEENKEMYTKEKWNRRQRRESMNF